MRLVAVLLFAGLLQAQDPKAESTAKPVEPVPPKAFKVTKGTSVPLSMINSVSTKTASDGERVYLETVFPILADGRVIIPPGSYVAGTLTNVKRPGKVKGRAQFFVRFDSLTLPNGATRDFRARITNLDGRASEELEKSEGRIKSEGNKAGDAKSVGEGAMIGAGIGALGGQAAGHLGMGAGIGAAAGATAGLIGVLMSRGPDAVLAKGTTLEMVLDRDLVFDEHEIDFVGSMSRPSNSGSGPLPSRRMQSQVPGSRSPAGGRWPY